MSSLSPSVLLFVAGADFPTGDSWKIMFPSSYEPMEKAEKLPKEVIEEAAQRLAELAVAFLDEAVVAKKKLKADTLIKK